MGFRIYILLRNRVIAENIVVVMNKNQGIFPTFKLIRRFSKKISLPF